MLQGQGLLAHSRAKDPADPGIPSLEQQLATGQEQLAAGEAQWQAGYDQYLEGRTAYQQGEDTVAAINGLRMVSSDGSTAIVQIQFDRNTNSCLLYTSRCV